MTALDIAGRFVDAAVTEERHRPLGIRYLQGSAVALPSQDGAFDFVVAFMSLMDMPDLLTVLAEVHRVLRLGGFLQFSIEHPGSAPPASGWVKDKHGRRVAAPSVATSTSSRRWTRGSLAPRPKRSGATGDRFGSRGFRARSAPG